MVGMEVVLLQQLLYKAYAFSRASSNLSGAGIRVGSHKRKDIYLEIVITDHVFLAPLLTHGTRFEKLFKNAHNRNMGGNRPSWVARCIRPRG